VANNPCGAPSYSINVEIAIPSLAAETHGARRAVKVFVREQPESFRRKTFVRIDASRFCPAKFRRFIEFEKQPFQVHFSFNLYFISMDRIKTNRMRWRTAKAGAVSFY
jgi:hypothetical protein